MGCTVPCVRSSQSELSDAAKNGERDTTRLYEQALITFGIEDMSMVFVSVGRRPRPGLRFGQRTQRDLREPGFSQLGSHSVLLARIQTAVPSTF